MRTTSIINKTYLIIFVLGIIALSSCQGNVQVENKSSETSIGKLVEVPGSGSYRDLSVAELQDQLSSKDFILVNVHIPFEGDLPDTDLSIPFDKIDQNLDKLPADKNARIVLYCRSDRMSNIAAEELVRQGYTNIWNLDGGMIAWEKAGLPIIK